MPEQRSIKKPVSVERELRIYAAPDRVFAFVAELDNLPKWSSHKGVSKGFSGPPQPGATFTAIDVQGQERSLEVVEYTAGSVIAWRDRESGSLTRLEVRPQEEDTVLKQTFQGNLVQPMLIEKVVYFIRARFMAWGQEGLLGLFLARELRRVRDSIEKSDA